MVVVSAKANEQQERNRMTNSTIIELCKQLEKSNATIVDLVVENFQTVEYIISPYGDFLGFDMILSAKNMSFCLKDRVYESNAVVEGYVLINNSKTELKFPLDRELSWEIWSRVKGELKESEVITINAPQYFR